MLPPLVRWRLPLGVVGALTVAAGAAFLVGAQLAFEAGTIVDVAAPLLALVARRVRRRSPGASSPSAASATA